MAQAWTATQHDRHQWASATSECQSASQMVSWLAQPAAELTGVAKRQKHTQIMLCNDVCRKKE